METATRSLSVRSTEVTTIFIAVSVSEIRRRKEEIRFSEANVKGKEAKKVLSKR